MKFVYLQKYTYMRTFTSRLLLLTATLFILGSCKKVINVITNKTPIADAGPSQTIFLPTKTIMLNGTGQDADGQVLAYLWSEVSGPGNSIIDDPGSKSTSVSGLTEGTYIFQLMVTDNDGATGVDTTSVIVNPGNFTTVVITTQSNPNEFRVGTYNGGDQTLNATEDMPIEAWTAQGKPLTIRGIIKFDLSSIPAGAQISSATLSIYSDPFPANGNRKDANYGNNNSMFVQQVTSDWLPSTISWFNQPTVTTANQVNVPTTSKSFLDLNLDVTAMTTNMWNNNANYGYFLRLQQEVILTSRIFCTSFNPDVSKHPKLTIVYSK